MIVTGYRKPSAVQTVYKGKTPQRYCDIIATKYVSEREIQYRHHKKGTVYSFVS